MIPLAASLSLWRSRLLRQALAMAGLAALVSACGGTGQGRVNSAATATAVASATAAAIPVVVGVTATQTQSVAGGHPHLAAAVAIRNQTAQPIYVVEDTCRAYDVILDIGDATGKLIYRRAGTTGCVAGAVRSFVTKTIAPGVTSTTIIDADLTIMASKVTPGQTYTVQANLYWRTQDGTYLEPNTPPEYKASSDVFVLTLQ